jgi:spermidine synthase
VKPFVQVGAATAPDGTRLTLHRHDGAYLLRADGAELMSTRRTNSEVALAEVACGPLASRPGVQVLIGGLGLGFTLRAALARLAPDATVVVAEIVPAVIEWNRNPEFGLGLDALGDPRVVVREADVLDVIRDATDAFDAIMLDIDNGANAITNAGNQALYSARGIRETVRALRQEGVVVYWSAAADAPFARALRKSGLTVETVQSRAHTTTGPQHELIVARR